jgi:hypothetical protein
MMTEAQLREKAEHYRNHPKIAPLLEEFQRFQYKKVFEPEFREGWIKVLVRRDGGRVEIRWETSRANESSYTCNGFIHENAYFAKEGFLRKFDIPASRGNDRYGLTLEQGLGFHVYLTFFDEATEDDLVVTFQIFVPLTPEGKELVTQERLRKENPKDEVAERVDAYLKNQDAFDKALKTGIARIKRKNLPSEEEEQRIEDFREDLKWMMEEFRK